MKSKARYIRYGDQSVKLNQPRRRCLRTYEAIAQGRHSCTECDIPIFSGDRYGGRVVVCGHWLWVEKFHLGCPVDPGDDIRERLRGSHEGGMQNVA